MTAVQRHETSAERYWENWDKGKAAEAIDGYWLSSALEREWRGLIVADMRREFGSEASLLEIGCGSGLIYRELLEAGVVTPGSYRGGDVSRSMLSLAQQRFPGVEFSALDIMHLPYGDRSQENVICIHVLQHLPRYDAAVAELMRVASRKLYLASWFTPDPEDRLTFNEPSEECGGQPFQNNCYSLPRFLAFVFENRGRDITGVRVRKIRDTSYALCLAFD